VSIADSVSLFAVFAMFFALSSASNHALGLPLLPSLILSKLEFIIFHFFLNNFVPVPALLFSCGTINFYSDLLYYLT
jgi:hypothetical protein